jgi:transmembrane sensor
MKRPDPHQPDDTLGATAANWVVRRDRGLSAAESVEFELWLAADPRHAAAMSRTTQAWDLLDRIPEHTAHQIAARTTRRRRFWRSFIIGTSLAAAASLALVFWPESTAPRVATSANEPSPFVPRQLALADGSIVELNRDSEVVAQFTRTERRVILLKGEAYFSVTKDPARPFIVRAGHVDVRAVGTAFNVNLQSAAVEVLVTEGTVKLDPSADGTSRQVPLAAQIPSLVPGQRAVVALKPSAPEVAVVVTTVSQAEMARTMAWQEPLLRLGGATLAEVAANFERRTGRRVVLSDPALGRLRVGGRFRADDVEGFASVLATTLDIEVESLADGQLRLRKKVQIRDSGK